MEQNKTQLSLEFKYEGQNFIDINTLLVSQFHFLAVISELQKEVDPEAKIKIKVGAFREGSFIIDLLVEASWLPALLFGPKMPGMLKDVVALFRELIELRKTLKGETAKQIKALDGNRIEIHGDNNVVVVSERAFDVYKSNPIVSKAMEENFKKVQDDEEIEGISIQTADPTEAPISIGRDEFEVLQKPNKYFQGTSHGALRSNETVYIKKPNLFPEGKKPWKWLFIHRGRDITAKITDDAFRATVNKGLKIGQGDRLLVDMIAQEKYDSRYGTYVETGTYEISHVRQIIPRPIDPVQQTMFGESDQ